MTDSVPEEVKKRRLNELVSTFYSTAAIRNQRFIGTHQLVLVEGEEVQTPDHLPFARFHSLRLYPIPHPTEYVNTRDMHLHSVCLAHESIVGMASCSRHVYM